jgi:hypothetical protein
MPGAELRAVPGQGQLLRLTVAADFKNVHKVRFEDPGQPAPRAVRGSEVVCPGS